MVLRQPCCPSNSCSTGRIFLAFPSPYSRNLMPWSWLVSRMYHACTTHVPRMYHACTTHVPGLYLPIPSHAPGLYVACTWLWAHFCFLLSTFCFRLVVALGGFRQAFARSKPRTFSQV